MAIRKISNALVYCLAADTKPTTMATDSLAYVVDTGDVYRYSGGTWNLITPGPAATATLTNKSINATNNTITDTSTATGDLLKSDGTKFARFARGTADQYLTTNSGGTDIAWSDNLALGPVRGKRWGTFIGVSGTNGSGLLQNNVLNTGNGTVAIDTTNGSYVPYNTAATIGDNAANRAANSFTVRNFNPFLGVKFILTSATNQRVWVGFRNSNGLPSSGTEDSIATTGIGVMLTQRSTDTNFQIINNSASTSTVTDTGVAVAANTLYTLKIQGDAANNKWQWSLNGSAYADLTTNIPSSTAGLLYYAGIQTTEAVIHTLRLISVEIFSDK